jgi:hypothetical protein
VPHLAREALARQLQTRTSAINAGLFAPVAMDLTASADRALDQAIRELSALPAIDNLKWISAKRSLKLAGLCSSGPPEKSRNLIRE